MVDVLREKLSFTFGVPSPYMLLYSLILKMSIFLPFAIIYQTDNNAMRLQYILRQTNVLLGLRHCQYGQ